MTRIGPTNMTRIVLVGALALTCAAVALARAQQSAPWSSPLLHNDKLIVDYREPIDPKFLSLEADDPKYGDDYREQKDHYDRINSVYERLRGSQL